MTTDSADLGLIGLAVMGQNLVLNMADHGYRVAVYNRTNERTDEFMAGPAADTDVVGTHSIEELVGALHKPRKVMLMIKAGDAVDAVIDQLLPLLEPGDVIIDGGNSLFTDSRRRAEMLESKGFLYVGTGISGGEEGARHGPSLMPGGTPQAWPLVRDIFQGIAAKLDDGTPCCDWVGSDGAGHYVKMVHNGIEYGDMQLIAEAYHMMSVGLGLSHEEMHQIFSKWNDGVLDSYLVEITADIMAHRTDGEPTLEKILDAAGQKGTGKWTVISSMELGSPTTLVAEAVYARIMSAMKEARVSASARLDGPSGAIEGDRDEVVSDLGDATYAAKIMSYTQGFLQMREAATEYGWDLDFGSIATMWRGGTIIRSVFLENIRNAYRTDPALDNLLSDAFFHKAVEKAQPGWRRTITRAIESGIPVPAYATALFFYDAIRTARLPANLIQAQRDYFGAHTYERIDSERGEFFHTNWTGTGGDTTAGSYSA